MNTVFAKWLTLLKNLMALNHFYGTSP